ncbi:MAG: sodium-dependent transporter [Bacteroidaceae bacterium]|nr:sodium-dependent transporter [Bacteroidaceae bacterium]MBO7267236.1 sodium-dependent transporter [Bacteroidaceae bacterium]
MSQQTRENFGSKMGAILAAAGSAVGLGNIWRFPIETGQNGGAAFIIVYIGCVLLLGIPIMMSEFVIGRHTHTNTAGAYRIMAPGTAWKWVGRLGVLSGFVILSYYSVVAGWTAEYTILAVSNSFDGKTTADFPSIFANFVSNPWKPLLWLLAFMITTHFIVVRGVKSGIERFSKIMMPALFVIMIVLTACSVMLPGAREGLHFLLKPDFSKITGTVVLNAMGQAFFSLSLGLGCLCTYASYFGPDTNIGKTALNVSLIDTMVAIMSGFIIFPAVFNAGYTLNSSDIGPSLLFITLPNVFQQAFGSIPALSYIVSVLFYFLLVVAALTSTISMHEVVTAYVSEEFNMPRRKAATIVTIACSLVGVVCSLSFGPFQDVKLFGMSIFDLFDYVSSNIFLPVGGMFISLFAGWYLDRHLLRDEITNGNTLRAPYFRVVIFILRYIAPVAIGIILLNQLGIFRLF